MLNSVLNIYLTIPGVALITRSPQGRGVSFQQFEITVQY